METGITDQVVVTTRTENMADSTPDVGSQNETPPTSRTAAVVAPHFIAMDYLLSWRCILALGLLAVVYVTIGGVAFHAIEGPRESERRHDLKERIQQFLDTNPCVPEEDLQQLLGAVIAIGVLPTGNDTEPPSKWSLMNSIFFSITVVTTIGYGHLAPVTEAGRVFCAFYALWGIPLFMTPIAGVGDRLNRSTQRRLRTTRFANLHPILSEALRSLAIFFCGLVVFVLLPAWLFSSYEEWSFSDAVYYAFITCATIGFGDFVAGINPDRSYPIWYRVFRFLWLVCGLMWVSWVVGLKARALVSYGRKRRRRNSNSITSTSFSWKADDDKKNKKGFEIQASETSPLLNRKETRNYHDNGATSSQPLDSSSEGKLSG